MKMSDSAWFKGPHKISRGIPITALVIALVGGLIGPAAQGQGSLLGCAASAAADPCKPRNPDMPPAGTYQGTYKIQVNSSGLRNLELISQQEEVNGTLKIVVGEKFTVTGDVLGDYTGSLSETSARIDYHTQRIGKIYGHLEGFANQDNSFHAKDATWGIDTTDNKGYSSTWSGDFSGEFYVLDATCATLKGMVLKDNLENPDSGFNALLLPSHAWLDMIWQAQMEGREPGLEQEIDQMIASSLQLVPHRNLIANLLKKARELEFSTDLQPGAVKCMQQKLFNAARTIANNRVQSALKEGTLKELMQLAKDLQMLGYQQDCDLVAKALARALELAKAALKEAVKTGDVRLILEALRDVAMLSSNIDSKDTQDAWTTIEKVIDTTMQEAMKTGNMDLVVKMTDEAYMLGLNDLAQKGMDWLAQHGYQGKKK